jgi:hypothetical protein
MFAFELALETLVLSLPRKSKGMDNAFFSSCGFLDRELANRQFMVGISAACRIIVLWLGGTRREVRSTYQAQKGRRVQWSVLTE